MDTYKKSMNLFLSCLIFIIYGEGSPDSTYYKVASTFRYGQTGQNFWTTSYAQTGYQATGWNTSCNSWGSPTYILGYVVTNSWIHSHAGQLINVAQTFSSY